MIREDLNEDKNQADLRRLSCIALGGLPALPAAAGPVGTQNCYLNATLTGDYRGDMFIQGYARTIPKSGTCGQISVRIKFALAPGGAQGWSAWSYGSVQAYSPTYPYTFLGGHDADRAVGFQTTH
jgi:hypothetical protein